MRRQTIFRFPDDFQFLLVEAVNVIRSRTGKYYSQNDFIRDALIEKLGTMSTDGSQDTTLLREKILAFTSKYNGKK